MNEQVSDSFLVRLHTEFSVPRAAVVSLAERATGAAVVEIQRIVDGYDNEVYRVSLAGGTIVYPRIRRGGESAGGVDGEAWAMDKARRAAMAQSGTGARLVPRRPRR